MTQHRSATRISAPEFARIARRIMDENGLSDWAFEWGRGVSQVACCDSDRKVLRFSRAAFTGAMYVQVLDTIYHEVAHAVTGDGHTERWRETFVRLGGSGERTWKEWEVHQFGPKMAAKRRAAKPRNVTLVVCKCPACGRTDERTRRTRIACGRCCKAAGGGWRPEYEMEWFRVVEGALEPYPLPPL